MKHFLLIITSLIFVSCAAPNFNYQPKTFMLTEPSTGKKQKVYIGNAMIRQGKFKEYDAIFLNQNVGAGWAYHLSPGYYLKKGEGDSTEIYMPSGGENSGAVHKSWFADPWSHIIAYKNKDVLCVITMANVDFCSLPTRFERKKKYILTGDSFQQTLVYNGKIGNKISVGYRAVANTYTKPAFNKNFEFDLKSSNIIEYKNVRLRIIEATDQYIRYEVIRNFNDESL